MIMARLRKDDAKSKYLEFLIDSGADYTMISSSYAEALGLKYEDIESKEIKVDLANNSFIHTKEAPFTMTIEGKDLTIPVLIANEELEPLLGRKGVFENYDITFQEHQQRVIFKKI